MDFGNFLIFSLGNFQIFQSISESLAKHRFLIFCLNCVPFQQPYAIFGTSLHATVFPEFFSVPTFFHLCLTDFSFSCMDTGHPGFRALSSLAPRYSLAFPIAQFHIHPFLLPFICPTFSFIVCIITSSSDAVIDIKL